MFRLLALSFAAAALAAFPAHAEQAQFQLEIHFTGCHVKEKRSICEKGVVAVDELVTEPFRLIGDQKNYPGFAQAHYVKPYRLRWEQFGEEKDVVVALRITREPFLSKDIDVHLAVFPPEGEDDDMRETSVSVERLEEVKSLWLSSRSDRKPAGEKGEWKTWASVTIKDLKSIP